MQNLIPHPTTDKVSFSIQAELLVQGTELLLEFGLGQGSDLFALPSQEMAWPGGSSPRRNGLWQGTCFEAFVSPVGLEKYYEFNFSLAPAWNVYEFDGYRTPQPPKASQDFLLKSMHWNPSTKNLSVIIDNHTPYRQFQVGLTAVLLEKSGVKHYLALAHAGEKPDFHLRGSFILQRGSKL